MSEKKKNHGVQLLLRTVITDSKGKVIQDSGQKPAKSFVIQFLEFIHAVLMGTITTYNATDTLGVESRIYVGSTAFDSGEIDAPINQGTYGIVVGTGDTPVDNVDNKLVTQLTEGVGAGNITHGVMIIGAVAVVGANVDLELKRSFPNNTGSTITIKEAGLYFVQGLPPPDYHHCAIRDVLGIPVVLPDKCALTVYYTLRTTV